MPDHQQIGETAGKHVRFLERIVEIQRERHGVFIEIAQKLQRERLQPRLGIAHGGGGIAVHRAEIAVSVDERATHVEILRHAHHGVIDGRIAVRVIFTHTVADDTRRLFVRLVGREPHLVHGVQNAPLHGLQTVFDAGKRTVKDDELRIREHGLRQHLFERRDEQRALRFLLSGFSLHCRPPF